MAGSAGYRAVMPAPRPWRQMVEDLRKVCRAELDAVALARAAFSVIRRHVPVDAAFVSAVDPATMLFTQPLCQEVPTEAILLFLHNEFAEPDAAKFRKIALADEPVEWLDRAHEGKLGRQPALPGHPSDRLGWATNCAWRFGPATPAGR